MFATGTRARHKRGLGGGGGGGKGRIMARLTTPRVSEGLLKCEYERKTIFTSGFKQYKMDDRLRRQFFNRPETNSCQLLCSAKIIRIRSKAIVNSGRIWIRILPRQKKLYLSPKNLKTSNH